ncbi:hypothetical protein PoB_002115800 [Plakobranchus ocellatus]|uniref:Uncharacterized protein n=1 Tax=Plakobranchus ocellatus TaxID=259542 RepID=A0AAV3ZIL5_9GAST|nr:hypothetical protein PoB_002115800 [Plakobranchus ocellatus]
MTNADQSLIAIPRAPLVKEARFSVQKALLHCWAPSHHQLKLGQCRVLIKTKGSVGKIMHIDNMDQLILIIALREDYFNNYFG